MQLTTKTFSLAAFGAALLSTALAATSACSKEPQLNVQSAPATATPAAVSSPVAPPLPASAANETTALAPGHPPMDLPPGHPPAGDASGMGGGMAAQGIALPPVDPASGLGAAGLVWKAPQHWVEQPPANPMRRAQYRVPGTAGDGELVVFYFGPNQGGPPLENAQRWAMQFAQPDGGDPLSALKTRSGDIHGIPAFFVETTGTYNPGTMSGSAPATKEKWGLLAVIAQGGDANWFFKFTGPQATVNAERAAFEELANSIRRGN